MVWCDTDGPARISDHGVCLPSISLHTERESLMSHEFVLKNGFRMRQVFTAWSAAALLVACGGEGDGSISANNGSQVLLKAGESALVAGTLESVKYRLTSMSWSVAPLAASNPVLSLSNQNCAVAEKSDMLTPTPGTSTSPAGSGGSTWRCNLVVSTKAKLITTDAHYELVLSGVNEAGQQVSYKRALRVQPNPNINSLGVTYLNGMSIQPLASVCKPGASFSLQAQGIDTSNPVFNYRWRVVQGPDVVLVGADQPTVGLILPLVSASTLMVFQLEASTSAIAPENPEMYMAQVVVHVDPNSPYPLCGSYP